MEEQRRLGQTSETGVGTATGGGVGGGDGTEDVAATGDNTELPSTSSTGSPPAVDDLSLQDAMDLNKESLKRKLMLRRSVTELVDQGIYPSLKAPAAFAEQRKQLERAKTGDLLRHKLKMRPDRESLVQHHILEDTTVDPSLQDRQKLLKKARLQDSLNDRLANRPGPLELVEGNILETDPELKDAIKEGKLQFVKTSELGDPLRRHFKEEPEDGSASEGGISPVQSDSFSDQAFSPLMIPTPPDITPLLRSLKQTGVLSPPVTGLTLSQISNATFVTSPTSNALSPPAMSSGSSTSSQTSNSSSSSRLARLKKQKSKTPPKARVIKFHEYKGPPNALKSQPSSPPVPQPLPPVIPSGSDTPYNILLQQQQLLLQWQLENRGQAKSLPSSIFLSATGQKPVLATASSSSPTEGTIQSQTVTLQRVVSPPAQPTPGKVGLPQKPTTVTMVSPLTTSIPVSRPSPAPTPASGTSSIPVAVPTSMIPVTCQVSVVGSVSPVVTNVVKAIVATPAHKASSENNKDSSKSSNNNFRPSRTNVTMATRPPITKLDDLKVAELKDECKKRNLPVSGPKPNLLEKLKPFADEIVASWKNAQNAHGQGSVRPNSCASNISSISSFNNDNSLTSPPSVQSITNMNHLINIQPLTPLNDDAMSMTFGSPPMSPTNSVVDTATSSQSNQPMTPDMDTMSPTSLLPSQLSIKNHLNSSQTIMPMTIDPHSRPPSVIPMDIDLNGSQTNLAALSKDQNMNPRLAKSTNKGTKDMTSMATSSSTGTISQAQPALAPPPAPPLPPNAQIITIRQQAPVQTLTAIQARQLQIQSTQTGHIQLQAGQPGQIQFQTAQPGQVQIQGAKPGQIQIQGTLQNQQVSAQLRAQLLQQISAQMIRVPASGSQVAAPQVARTLTVTGQPMVSGTISMAQPRPVLTQATQITPTASLSRTSAKTIQNRGQTLLQVAPSSSQNTTLVQVAAPTTQLVTTVQTPQGLPTQVQVAVPQSAAQQTILQPIGQPPVISNEELVKRQQKQIEELRRQLMQYQVRLADAQQKEKKHNEQLQMHLAQAQIQGPDQAKAQQEVQVQAKALAQAKAQVQALQQQAQVQVQAAVQLQAQTESKALTQSQNPAKLMAQPHLTYKGQLALVSAPSPASRTTSLTAASPASSLTAASPAQNSALSPASTVISSPIQAPTPSPAQMVAPSPVAQMLAPSPVQSILAPSPGSTQSHPSPLATQSLLTPSPLQTAVSSPQASFQSPPPPPPPSQTIVIQPQTSVAMATNNKDGTADIKPMPATLNEYLQNQAAQQGLTHKLILTAVQPNGQQVLLTSQPSVATAPGILFQGQQPKTVTAATASKAGKAAVLQLNGVTSRPSSVPSSPSKAAPASSPFFQHSVLREPPKYDEAIKNKQKVLLLNPGTSSMVEMSSSSPGITTTTTAPSVAAPVIKSEDIDDVFEILIRNGELPASAAQEPPATPKVEDGSAKSSGTSSSTGHTGSLSNLYPGNLTSGLLSTATSNTTNMTSIIDSSKLKRLSAFNVPSSSKSMSPADTVLSIANGLKYSTPFALQNNMVIPATHTDVLNNPSSVQNSQTLHTSPRTVSSVTSPLSTSASPLGSDSGVGSSVGRKDLLPPLSISPALSPHSNMLPQSLTDNLGVDFAPFMDWSDSDLPDNLLDSGETDMCVDTDIDSKDFAKTLHGHMPKSHSLPGLPPDDLFTAVPSISVPPHTPILSKTPLTGPSISCPSPGSSNSSNINGLHSEPNLREFSLGDMEMMDPTSSMNIDVSDWLDVVMPPSGLTPTTVNPPATNAFCADPILTPKSQEFLDLFNLVESDLYTPTDPVGLPFEKAMEASTSKS